jgi:pyruvate,water dikinase
MGTALHSEYIRPFNQINLSDLPEVGGKNASLGEMIRQLGSTGINVPDGFALTAAAYRQFLAVNQLTGKLAALLRQLDRPSYANLQEIGAKIRQLILEAPLPPELKKSIAAGYQSLKDKYGRTISLAVRSSATAEDLPQASFAGQQETYLNVRRLDSLETAVHHCFASLYTDRAIKYREDNGFAHLKVALSVGIQLMVRSDKACSGVIFTLEPDSGFRDVVLVSGAWGLGENVVQGTVNPDEFYVFKPTYRLGKQAIISHKLGSKAKTMVYARTGTVNKDTPRYLRDRYVLTDPEILQLADWAMQIEAHYGRPMDIEWAKDGLSGQLYIVQARPETAHSAKTKGGRFFSYQLKEKGELICSGTGLGNKITAGKARLLHSPTEIGKLEEGDILVTEKTDPDWDPILKKAGAIVTDQGGRTSHAAIVAREVGAVAVVGTGQGTRLIRDGEEITVSTAAGETGEIYRGRLKWEIKEVNTAGLHLPKTQVMLILGDPDQAFRLSFYPNQGIGLMRLEFIINNAIQIHPLALARFAELTDAAVREKIEQLTHRYPDKKDYFIHQLAESVAIIAAAFYPKDVIVRMSDFKSNEYANLIGGRQFEPRESNPMLGFRGASRYYHPRYREGFEMECLAMKMVRDDMGLHNVKLMIPFCRTVEEARKVVAIMEQQGLKRGENGLELYMMTEIPSNVILAREFAEHFDGFSIGSNDLTQLVLGVDRDSELLSGLFSAQDPAVRELIRSVIKTARETHTKIGLCGQEPSDNPAFARFLVARGIDSISFNPDALFTGIRNVQEAELIFEMEK